MNAFASQLDDEMKGKVVQRLQNITHLQKLLERCLPGQSVSSGVVCSLEEEPWNSDSSITLSNCSSRKDFSPFVPIYPCRCELRKCKKSFWTNDQKLISVKSQRKRPGSNRTELSSQSRSLFCQVSQIPIYREWVCGGGGGCMYMHTF